MSKTFINGVGNYTCPANKIAKHITNSFQPVASTSFTTSLVINGTNYPLGFHVGGNTTVLGDNSLYIYGAYSTSSNPSTYATPREVILTAGTELKTTGSLCYTVIEEDV